MNAYLSRTICGEQGLRGPENISLIEFSNTLQGAGTDGTAWQITYPLRSMRGAGVKCLQGFLEGVTRHCQVRVCGWAPAVACCAAQPPRPEGRGGGRAGGRAAHPPRSMRSAGVMRRPARSALAARRRPLCCGGGKGRLGGAAGAQYTTSAENESISHSGAPDVASATRLSECAAHACARHARAHARDPAAGKARLGV